MAIAISIPSGFTIDSYDTLQASIADWLDRSDLTGEIPQMIGLAEPRINRALSPILVETSADITVTAGVGSFPTDIGHLKTVVYDNVRLNQCSPSEGVWLTGTVPIKYSIETAGIRLWPAATGTATLLYQPILAALSNSNQTNTILDVHPDVYFFGAMLFAEGFLANDSRAALFEQMFAGALEDTRQWLLRQRYAGPLVPTVAVP